MGLGWQGLELASLGASSMAPGDADGDAVQPGLDRRLVAEVVTPPMQDQEDLLDHVLDVAGGHPEAAHQRPCVAEVLAIGIDHPGGGGVAATAWRWPHFD